MRRAHWTDWLLVRMKSWTKKKLTVRYIVIKERDFIPMLSRRAGLKMFFFVSRSYIGRFVWVERRRRWDQHSYGHIERWCISMREKIGYDDTACTILTYYPVNSTVRDCPALSFFYCTLLRHVQAMNSMYGYRKQYECRTWNGRSGYDSRYMAKSIR